jgi:hypothetical protein
MRINESWNRGTQMPTVLRLSILKLGWAGWVIRYIPWGVGEGWKICPEKGFQNSHGSKTLKKSAYSFGGGNEGWTLLMLTHPLPNGDDRKRLFPL